ncbi:hypothetical protein [Novosphingobium olei]|uniref:Uncharacterized protein n=1 Tax=Novosphingobium olei TaxID=2728851 RepID=A0A7Y0GAS0_9SPHN|nr:hypothetical protein [Novosphingobium olei]NML93907.1 hypothetical protein [Novosphingobium olei]
MLQMIEANWIAVTALVVLVLLVAWLLWGRKKPAPARREYRDVLSEGAGPAQRNNALIDAPPAAAIPPIVPPIVPAPAAGIMAGVAEVVAHEAQEEVEAAPVVAAAPAAAPAEAGSADDLTRIKGVGPKLNARLKELGVTRFAQIAAWSEADLAAIDAQLGAFAGRPKRDAWIEQATLLAGGDTGAYEAKFGKL